jgi:hypothetical protein
MVLLWKGGPTVANWVRNMHQRGLRMLVYELRPAVT